MDYTRLLKQKLKKDDREQLIEVERDPTQVKLLDVATNELTVTESLVISTFYSS